MLGTAKTDVSKKYFGNYESTHLGPPRIVRFGSNDFYYYPAGDSLAIYRIEPPADAERGPTLKLASVLGEFSAESRWCPPGRDVAPRKSDILWEWNDTQGDGQIQYTPRTIPARPARLRCLRLPGLPDPDWHGSGGHLKWIMRAGFGWLPPIGITFPMFPIRVKVRRCMPSQPKA